MNPMHCDEPTCEKLPERKAILESFSLVMIQSLLRRSKSFSVLKYVNTALMYSDNDFKSIPRYFEKGVVGLL